MWLSSSCQTILAVSVNTISRWSAGTAEPVGESEPVGVGEVSVWVYWFISWAKWAAYIWPLAPVTASSIFVVVLGGVGLFIVYGVYGWP